MGANSYCHILTQNDIHQDTDKKKQILEKNEQEVEYHGRVFGSNGVCPSTMTKGKVKFFKGKAQKRLPKMKLSMNTLGEWLDNW